MKIEINESPFTRSLMDMENGKIDIMTGLLKTEERERYIYFVDPPYKTSSYKVFYVLKGKNNMISKYEDLNKLKIGIVFGSKYFLRFDNDSNLIKVKKYHSEELIPLLLNKGIDTFITSEVRGDYLIHEMGLEDKIEKTIYGYFEKTNVYIGISKKSHLAKNIDELSKIINEMIKDGRIDEIINNSLKKDNLPNPVYKKNDINNKDNFL